MKKKHIYFIGVDTLHSPIITTPEEPYPEGLTVFSLGLRNPKFTTKIPSKNLYTETQMYLLSLH